MYIPSPLNYTGGKFKLLDQILPHFPREIGNFVDLFCGGCNVGINIPTAERVVLNDINPQLIRLYQYLQSKQADEIIAEIEGIIFCYGLSQSAVHGYEYYDTNSSSGLAEANREAFLRLRADFNEKYDPVLFFVLILYAFNNQIRFNKKGEYNLPVGKRDFNANMQAKLRLFLEKIHGPQSLAFTCSDFRAFDTATLQPDSLVYCDPPYLITCAAYNERGGWGDLYEQELLSFLDELNAKGFKFALSNVLRAKGLENTALIEWGKQYRVIHLNQQYANSNYQRKDREKRAEEVLIVNYE